MNKESLIDRIKERQWYADDTKHPVVYVDDVEELLGDASTRKDEDRSTYPEGSVATSPANLRQCEISVTAHQLAMELVDARENHYEDAFPIIQYVLDRLGDEGLINTNKPVSGNDTGVQDMPAGVGLQADPDAQFKSVAPAKQQPVDQPNIMQTLIACDVMIRNLVHETEWEKDPAIKLVLSENTRCIQAASSKRELSIDMRWEPHFFARIENGKLMESFNAEFYEIRRKV